MATWDTLRKSFEKEFCLLQDDNEIVAKIYNTKQGQKELARAYGRHLKELIGKMESQPVDGFKKRWFVEGPKPSLKRKMKIVPPSSYDDAYNGAMDLECEYKTSKKKGKSSSEENDSSSDESGKEGSKKKGTALQRDMECMMREFKAMKGSTSRTEGDVWCTKCKEEGHTKGTCPKKAFCEICQVMGHSIKECPYNMKAQSTQVLFTE